MAVRPGYKQTEVGLIPEGWKVNRLADLSERITVGIASAATHAYRDKGIPLLRNQNIKSGYLDDSDILHITPEYESQFQNKRLRTGDLLTARTGYPGTTCVVTEKYDAAQSFTTLITRPRPKIIDSVYLCCYINSEYGQKFFEKTQIGGAQKNVNAGALREMPIPVPNLTEQRPIAAALSDVDALLAKLDQLIAKKRDLKQATMQQLLTGQTRLPGFDQEWEVKHLGDIGHFIKGSGVRKNEASSGDLRCLRYGEIYTRHNDYIKDFYSWISSEVAVTAVRLKQGDLCFAGSGETKAEIGKCVAFVDDAEAYAGGDIVILRPDHENSVFLGYYLNTKPVNSQKASRGQGDAVVHISAAALSSIEVKLPKIAEQTAIATVLSDMDAELAALEARRDKTCALKQGMM